MNIADNRLICNDFLVDFVGISGYIFYRKLNIKCSIPKESAKDAPSRFAFLKISPLLYSLETICEKSAY
jgi:hypothetical protein